MARDFGFYLAQSARGFGDDSTHGIRSGPFMSNSQFEKDKAGRGNATAEDDLMRILMISPQFRPLVGGYEQAAQRLWMALAAAGIGVVVIAERRDRTWPAVERIDGYELRRLPCLYRRSFHTLTSLFSFAGFLLRHGREFDVWHIHQYGVHAALAVAVGSALRRPAVLKLTSSGPMGIDATLRRGVAGRILGFFHRRVSACLAGTDETRAEAIGFGIPAQRVHLLPGGVDGRQFHPASSEERSAARG